VETLKQWKYVQTQEIKGKEQIIKKPEGSEVARDGRVRVGVDAPCGRSRLPKGGKKRSRKREEGRAGVRFQGVRSSENSRRKKKWHNHNYYKAGKRGGAGGGGRQGPKQIITRFQEVGEKVQICEIAFIYRQGNRSSMEGGDKAPSRSWS